MNRSDRACLVGIGGVVALIAGALLLAPALFGIGVAVLAWGVFDLRQSETAKKARRQELRARLFPWQSYQGVGKDQILLFYRDADGELRDIRLSRKKVSPLNHEERVVRFPDADYYHPGEPEERIEPGASAEISQYVEIP